MKYQIIVGNKQYKVFNMETKMISYSFFEPKSIHKEMRFWDLYNNKERYWYNIPALMAINSYFYGDFNIKIHVSKNIKDNYLYEVLEKIESNYDNVEIVEMPYDYNNTEPTMWRYKPLFNKESDIVLCRDIDSLPNEDELKATYHFIENNNFYIHTLRTHTNHASYATIILAGLCGYRPKSISLLKNINFDLYYNHFKNTNWGLDQNSLIAMFTRDPVLVRNHFLDSPISTEHHIVGNALINCISKDQDFYRENVDISKYDKGLIEFLNKYTKWAGEPTNFRGEILIDLFKFEIDSIKKMESVIESCSQKVKDFYLKNN